MSEDKNVAIAEKRRAPRSKVSIPAMLFFERHAASATCKNLSATGARIEWPTCASCNSATCMFNRNRLAKLLEEFGRQRTGENGHPVEIKLEGMNPLRNARLVYLQECLDGKAWSAGFDFR